MLSRKLQIILAKKKKFGSRKFFKKDKKKEPTCYECNQPGHYKSECLRLKKKEQVEKSDKKKGKEKKFRRFKKKAMAATWDNEDSTSSDSSSSESEEEEKANLALMAGLEQHPFEISIRLLCSLPFFAPSYSPAKDLQKSSAKPHPLEKKMASPRAQVFVQLTSDQLQRLAKIPICSGKSVEFSHLSGNLAWVEETLTAMGWTKLCQISEPFVASAVRSFYASLKVLSGNTVVGYVKGTQITISEEYLVELLDCPNSGHCLSEFIPLEKQKLGIIGSLETLCKRGLQVNELSAEKRLIHSIISNIITPGAGTHSSITARDGNLLFWAIQRHRVNLPAVILERMIAAKDLQESLPYGSLLTMIFKKLSVDLSGDVPMSTKEKIGLITLRRSHYSLVGKMQNLWYKDSVPECEHEVYPDEPLVSLLTQDIPASSIQIKAPPVPAIPDVFVQPPEPIIEQAAQPVIPPEVPSEDAQLPASSLPEQEAPSETVHEVLRDLRGKGILSEDVPMEHIFEEREPSYSPSQFETRPRSHGESSSSLSTILELVRTQQENLSVLHMQVEVIDVKFDSLADEVKQIKDLMLQFVCQQGTPRSAGPAPSQQQEEVPSAQEPQHQDQTQEKLYENQELEQTVEKDQEIQADQQHLSDEIQQPLHQQQQVSEPQLAVVVSQLPEEQQQQQEPSSPAPPVVNPPEVTPAAPSSTAPSTSVPEKSHCLTPQEFVDLYPKEAMRFQEAQSRNHHLKIYTHISLQFHDLFATLLRDSQAKYTAMKAFNFERFNLGLHDVSRGQYDMLIRGQRPVVPSMSAALLADLHPPLVGVVFYRGTFADTLYNRFLRISTRFKIKYKSKLSFQRFILLHIPKFQKNLLDL
ncbi:hypothetical protein Taro_047247, partial [Colocasia esculenta]|nr:hypothetical protein [Colocasia esculenta]